MSIATATDTSYLDDIMPDFTDGKIKSGGFELDDWVNKPASEFKFGEPEVAETSMPTKFEKAEADVADLGAAGVQILGTSAEAPLVGIVVTGEPFRQMTSPSGDDMAYGAAQDVDFTVKQGFGPSMAGYHAPWTKRRS